MKDIIGFIFMLFKDMFYGGSEYFICFYGCCVRGVNGKIESVYVMNEVF